MADGLYFLFYSITSVLHSTIEATDCLIPSLLTQKVIVICMQMVLVKTQILSQKRSQQLLLLGYIFLFCSAAGRRRDPTAHHTCLENNGNVERLL